MTRFYNFIIRALKLLAVNAAALCVVQITWAQTHSSPQLRSEIKNLFQQYFEKQPFDTFPFLEKISVGVFITIEKDQRTLACLGDLRPHHQNLKEELIGVFDKILLHPRFAKALQTHDYRHWNVWVRFPQTPHQVGSIDQINPKQDGAMLKSGSKASIVLPGEARTHRYLLRLLKSKTGLLHKEAFTLYRIQAPGFKL